MKTREAPVVQRAGFVEATPSLGIDVETMMLSNITIHRNVSMKLPQLRLLEQSLRGKIDVHSKRAVVIFQEVSEKKPSAV